MDNLAPHIDTHATLRTGSVVRLHADGTVDVAIGAAVHSLAVGPSCLLTPQVGDRVLVADGALLAITRREGAAGRDDAATLRVPGTLQIQAASLQLSARDEVAISGDQLNVRTRQTTISSEQLSLAGRTVTAAAGVLHLVGRTITQVADHISSTAEQHVRHSTMRDDVHAASASMRCNGVYDVRADALGVVGDRVIKMDGGQVQIG